MQKQKYRSYNQQELKHICDILCDNIEDVLSALGIHDYRDNNKMITMSCPIHSGDNESALNLYYEGDTYRGNWKCRTHQCEKHFKASILGFIRGVLSTIKYNWSEAGDKICGFNEVMDFVQQFNTNISNHKNIYNTNIDQDKNNFSRIINKITDTKDICEQISREKVIQNIQIPSTYYIDRGFSTNILEKYDVGLCNNPNKPMYNRVVVPIYDDTGRFLVGCTGRSIFDKCAHCSAYHDAKHECPSKEKAWLYSKWKHSNGFKSQNYLYNFWNAKSHIYENGYAILVESPGNVWRLEENNIHNSVAIFGCNLSDRQKLILDSSGAMTLFIIMDNDDAGKAATIDIYKKCENTYRLFSPKISAADIGDMSKEEIELEIKDFIKDNL